MDVLTKVLRRKNMQSIRSKCTKDVVLLAKALWQKDHRYRKNYKLVFGKPDLTFKRQKLVVFVDSEYFHGKDGARDKHKIQSNKDFWWAKIEVNINRDKLVNKELVKTGWIVLRFWSKEIRKKLASCIDLIEENLL